jgi:hypothetical protein
MSKEPIGVMNWENLNGLYAVIYLSSNGPVLDTDYGFTSKGEALIYGKEKYDDYIVAVVKVEWLIR